MRITSILLACCIYIYIYITTGSLLSKKLSICFEISNNSSVDNQEIVKSKIRFIRKKSLRIVVVTRCIYSVDGKYSNLQVFYEPISSRPMNLDHWRFWSRLSSTICSTRPNVCLFSVVPLLQR